MSQSIAELIAKNVSKYELLVKNKKQGTTAVVVNSVKNNESILSQIHNNINYLAI